MVNPYYSTWQSPLAQPSQQLKGRPVTSIEEVKGSMIEFDGSVFYFPDLANKRIYTKQINLDGTSTINMYELKPIPQQQVINSSDYITREEFETALMQLQQEAKKIKEPAATEVQSAHKQDDTPVRPAPQTSYGF